MLLAGSLLAEGYDRVTSKRENYQDLVKYMYLIFCQLRNHAFCVLSNGIMALSNYWREEGDEVFLLHGAGYPFVLRKDGDNYRLVGPINVRRLDKVQLWCSNEDDLRSIALS